MDKSSAIRQPAQKAGSAKRRLADEYDAAQERGEVIGPKGGGDSTVSIRNAATAADLGLSRKAIHEARDKASVPIAPRPAALEIEAGAKRRLADEYDAAQERGEVNNHGGDRKTIKFENSKLENVTPSEIHEAREIRDAEAAEPGIVGRTHSAASHRSSAASPPRCRCRYALLLQALEQYFAPRLAGQNGRPQIAHGRSAGG